MGVKTFLLSLGIFEPLNFNISLKYSKPFCRRKQYACWVSFNWNARTFVIYFLQLIKTPLCVHRARLEMLIWKQYAAPRWCCIFYQKMMWSICLFSMITGFHYWSSVPFSLMKIMVKLVFWIYRDVIMIENQYKKNERKIHLWTEPLGQWEI